MTYSSQNYQGNQMQNTTNDKPTIFARLRNCKPHHQRNVLLSLASKGKTYLEFGQYRTIDPEFVRTIPDHNLFRYLTKFDAKVLETEHDIVRNNYSNGLRYYNKGRPQGAKNKNNNRFQHNNTNDVNFDALRELGDDEILEELELKPLPKTEPQTLPAPQNNTKPIDSLDLKIVLEAFDEFSKQQSKEFNILKDNLRRDIDIQNSTSFDILKDRLDRLFSEMKPNIIQIERKELPSINLGVQHKNFEKLLRICSSRLRNGQRNNVWLYGEAGTGKSTAAENVAKALDLPYYVDGKMSDSVQVLGYKGANHEYQPTNFRQAFEFGGVYLADEIDGSMPDALLALNGALANGLCAFPDKIVKRHNDFVFIAAANTTGTGGTIEYVGRFKQDAAFNDRFVFIDWPIDEALEDSMVSNKEWLAIVRHCRARLKLSTIKSHMITPRAALYGESLLAAGLPLEDVMAMTLKKGLTEAQWGMIK